MMLTGQIIKLKLKSFDHRLLDESVQFLLGALESTGAVVKGPIPLPVKRTIYTVNRSTHVNKKSREQFQTKKHKRLFYITPSANTVDELMEHKLPPGVEVAIKLEESK